MTAEETLDSQINEVIQFGSNGVGKLPLESDLVRAIIIKAMKTYAEHCHEVGFITGWHIGATSLFSSTSAEKDYDAYKRTQAKLKT